MNNLFAIIINNPQVLFKSVALSLPSGSCDHSQYSRNPDSSGGIYCLDCCVLL